MATIIVYLTDVDKASGLVWNPIHRTIQKRAEFIKAMQDKA